MKNKNIFEIEDLNVRVERKEVIRGLSLSVPAGEVHALMGRNGSGKSTLSYALMGHPRYDVRGSIRLGGKELLGLSADERARAGLFLAFQYPVAVPGVTVANFLRASLRSVRNLPPREIRKKIKSEITELGIPNDFMNRFLNEGFSGGEKKKLETLQLRLLQPKMAILDETDSGLDIDALKLISKKINEIRDKERGILLITHYQRMLDYVQPDQVHVLSEGKIIKTGGAGLAIDLEKKGYDWIRTGAGA